MKIKRLSLENYRCFETFEISFEQNLTVIVGKNGAGKTAILDALVVALGPYLSKFDEGQFKGFNKDDARKVKLREKTYEMEPQFPIQLDALGTWPAKIEPPEEPLATPLTEAEFFEKAKSMKMGEAFKLLRSQSWKEPTHYWRCSLATAKSRTGLSKAPHLLTYGHDMQEAARKDPACILPLLAYYGSGRLWSQQRLTEQKKSILSDSRTAGYRNCLDSASSFKEFAYWYKQLNIGFTQAVFNEMEGDVTEEYVRSVKEPLDAINNVIEICLQDTDWKSIYYNALEDQIIAKHKDKADIPLSQVSDGVRNIISLVSDITFRCCKLNGFLERRAPQLTPGIVLIDELDQHLHPAWQQQIIPALTNAFPKIQFIITTHSPHLLSTVPAQSIRILENGRVYLPSQETQGEQSRAILEKVFDVSAWPPLEISKKLKTYLTMVGNADYETPQALQLRQELENHFGKGYVELVSADIIIARFEAIKATEKKRNS